MPMRAKPIGSSGIEKLTIILFISIGIGLFLHYRLLFDGPTTEAIEEEVLATEFIGMDDEEMAVEVK